MIVPKRIFLDGPIGCGKSTLLQTALAPIRSHAGGFVTLRQMDGDRLLGFSLAPADGSGPGQLFLDFSKKPPQNNQVFADLGAKLLTEALDAPFAILDEFGGLELLVPKFCTALDRLLQSDVPCIGVLKSEEAARKLRQRVPLDSKYGILEQQLRQRLQQDPETLILTTSGWTDPHTPDILAQWVQALSASLK